VRRNADPVPLQVLALTPSGPRPLPPNALPDGEQWHPLTEAWWSAWVDSPLTADWPGVTWCELEVAALLHHRLMHGGPASLAAELRRRISLLGGTPQDRLRLRVTTATAEQHERQRAIPARDRYAALRLATPTDPEGEHREHRDDRDDADRGHRGDGGDGPAA